MPKTAAKKPPVMSPSSTEASTSPASPLSDGTAVSLGSAPRTEDPTSPSVGSTASGSLASTTDSCSVGSSSSGTSSSSSIASTASKSRQQLTLELTREEREDLLKQLMAAQRREEGGRGGGSAVAKGSNAAAAVRVKLPASVIRSATTQHPPSPTRCTPEQPAEDCVHVQQSMFWGKLKFAVLCFFLIASLYSFNRYAPPLAIPQGLVVDDPQRPGLAYDTATIKVRRPVLLVPGFMNSVLEVWQHDACADTIGAGARGAFATGIDAAIDGIASTLAGTSGKEDGNGTASTGAGGQPASSSESARLFRERMLGPQMLLMLLRDPQCFLRHLSLHNEVYGADPPNGKVASDGNTSSFTKPRDRVRVRPLGSLDSGDYIVPSYWAWAKIIRNLADIGYDPSLLTLLPFDWRLNPQLAEERDGHFHRMRLEVEERYRQAGGTKVVFVAHSYGGIMTTAFLNWAEGHEKGWAEKYVHTFMTIGSPMLGVPKVVSAFISGEIRTTAFLPSPLRALVDFHVPRSWRTDAVRTLAGAEALFIRGGDAIWPNVISLYNQSVILRGSDVYEMIRTLTRQSNSTAMHKRFTDKRHEYNTLPSLPKAPSMNVFAFYGADLQTEVGFAYTLAEDRLNFGFSAEGEGIDENLSGKSLLDAHLRRWFEEGGISLKQAEDALSAGVATLEKTFKFGDDVNIMATPIDVTRVTADTNRGNGNALPKKEGGKRVVTMDTKKPATTDDSVAASPTTSSRCAALANASSSSLDAPLMRRRDQFACMVEEIAGQAKELWTEYVYGGEEAIATDAVKTLLDAFAAIDAGAIGLPQNASSATDNTTSSPATAAVIVNISDAHKLALHSKLHKAAPGILWREEYLGSCNSGADMAIDTAVDGVRVLPLLATTDGRYKDALPPATATTTESGKKKDGATATAIPYRDHEYLKGVKVGAGDATVPLISLGYMARAPNGWQRDVGKVVTKEFFDGYSEAMHDRLVALKEEHRKEALAAERDASGEDARHRKPWSKLRMPRNSERKDSGDAPKTAADGSKPAAAGATAVSHSGSVTAEDADCVGVESKHYHRDHDGDTTPIQEKVVRPEAEQLIKTAAGNILAAVDIRGGTVSADHVDLLGNYELIMDILHIATGNEDKVHTRILSDIDERVAEAPSGRPPQ